MIIESSGNSSWTRGMFENEFLNPAARIFVLEQNSGQIPAFAVIWLLPEELHINNLAVLQCERCKGAAQKLLNYIYNFARENGCSVIYLEVSSANGEAIALYSKNGFLQTGTRYLYYANSDALLMEKRL